MESNIVEKVNNINKVTESQKDRFNSQSLVQEELFKFLINQIQIESAEKNLKDTLLKEFINKITSDDSEVENPLTNSQKIKLIEILFKKENEKSISILSLLKDSRQNNVLNIDTNKPKDFNAEEVKSAKNFLNVLDLIKKIQQSEMSLEEIENNKKNIEDL